jgi:uncharacterized protein YecT (DUF1311 family)
MKPALTLLLTCLSLASPGWPSQSVAQGDARPPACAQGDKIQIPPADLPTAEDRRTLASCDSLDLYFGIDHPADPAKARKCAYLEREKHKQTGEGGILEGDLGGAGVLTMIYANGKGAARSFDLALKFACECDAEEGEPESHPHGRIEHLVKLQSQHWTGADFSLCDDIDDSTPSGAISSEGPLACRNLQERRDQVARTTRLGKATANWSSKEKEALGELQRAAEAFFKARSENEFELSLIQAGAGLENKITETDKQAELNDAFVAALERFEQGQLPKFSAAQFEQADAEMNSTYSTLEEDSDVRDEEAAPSSITAKGIKITQRAWLRYRDAWVAFGQLKYPSVTAESWKAWLTRERIEMWKQWN